MLNIQRLAQNIPVAALFQEKGRVARDFAMLPGGEVWLASVELAGKSSQAPIPGKPKMLHSRAIPGGRAVDKFLKIPVDYRPVATKR